jgi:hypothetical protein
MLGVERGAPVRPTMMKATFEVVTAATEGVLDNAAE